jgi:hypothetical protein
MGLMGIGTTMSGHKYLEINEGGRWFNALWIWDRELILIWEGFGYLFGLHWHVSRGWLPKWGLRPYSQAGEFLKDLTI